MELGNVLKWGLIAVAAVLAAKWLGGLLSASAAAPAPYGPRTNGVLFMGPAGVYADHRYYGLNRGPLSGVRGATGTAWRVG